MPAHLHRADIIVPVGNRTIAGVRLEADAFQAERRRNDDGNRKAVQGYDVLAVEDFKTRVEFAWTPALEWCFVDDRRRQGDDRAHVQRAIGPTVETLADPGGDGVVDRRMTQRTGNADCRKIVVRSGHLSNHADDSIEFQQLNRDGGVVEIHLTCLDGVDYRLRKRVRV